MRLPTPGCQGRGAPAGQDDGRRHDRPRDRTKRVAGQVYTSWRRCYACGAT